MSFQVLMSAHLDARFEYVSPYSRQLTGYRPDEIVADSSLLLGRFHPEDRQAFHACMLELQTKPGDCGFEARYRHKDGHYLHVRALARREQHGEGSFRAAGYWLDATAQRAAERGNMAREAHMHTIVDQAPALIYIKDPKGRYQFVNRSYEATFGFSPRQMLGKTAAEFFPEALADEYARNDQEALARGEVLSSQENALTRQGPRQYLAMRFPLFDEKGGVAGVCGISTDITALEQLRSNLRESESRFQALVENAPMGVAVLQGDEIVYANAAELRLIGERWPEGAGRRTLLELTSPEDEQRLAARRAAVMAGQAVGATEYEIRRGDGSRGVIEANLARVEWQGAPALLAIHNDITARKQAEEALRSSEEKYRALVEGSLQGMIVHRDGVFQYVNPAGARIFGVDSPDALRGRGQLEFVPPEYHAAVRERWSRLARGETLDDVELEFIRADGSRRWVRANARLIEQGGMPAVLGLHVDITERKRAEDALRESEARYRAVVHNALNGIVIVQDGRIVFANPAEARLFGFDSPEEMIGRRFLESLPAEARPLLQERWTAITRGERVPEVEHPIVLRNGTQRWVRGVASLIMHDGKKAALGVHSDITQQREAARALAERTAVLQAIMDHAPVIISLRDLEGRYVMVNREFLDQFGVSMNEALGKSIADIAPEEFSHKVESQVQHVLDTQAFFVHEETVIQEKGPRINQVYRFPVFDDQGALMAVGGIAVDITSRKKMEEALRASETYLEAVLDLAPEGIVTHDSRFRVELFNRRAERMFGYDRKELLGEDVFTLMPKEHRARYVARVQRYLSDPSINLNARFEDKFQPLGERKDGSIFPIAIRAGAVQRSGEFTFTLVISDASRQKEHEAKLREQARTKSVMLATLSHEFRTPVTAILGFAQILREEENLTDEQREDLLVIERSTRHLLELVGDVLDAQKLEAGVVTLTREIFDLRHTMETLLGMFRSRCDEKGIESSLGFDGGVPRYAFGDERKLRQVLINLFANAIKFTDKGSITITVSSRDRKSVRFSIRDTGSGIRPEDLARLGRPFEQGSSERGGSGLGLSISKGLIELMGGELMMESEAGVGSVFSFELPIGDTGSFDPDKPDVQSN